MGDDSNHFQPQAYKLFRAISYSASSGSFSAGRFPVSAWQHRAASAFSSVEQRYIYKTGQLGLYVVLQSNKYLSEFLNLVAGNEFQMVSFRLVSPMLKEQKDAVAANLVLKIPRTISKKTILHTLTKSPGLCVLEESQESQIDT